MPTKPPSWLRAAEAVVAPAVFDAWNELWVGLALAYDRRIKLRVVSRRDEGGAAWVWKVSV